MKKFLSVLLSLVLCASIIVTNPPVEIGDGILTPSQNEQSEDEGDVANPCDDSGLTGLGGDIQG